MSRAPLGGAGLAMLVAAAMGAGYGGRVIALEDARRDDDFLYGIQPLDGDRFPRKSGPKKREPAIRPVAREATPDTMTRQRRRAEERAARKAKATSND